MPAPVRPVFKNGQRLTADRLTQALEYLRSWIRRLSLGPLSAGVAAGLTLEPFGTNRGLLVQPGLAIDGRGRLLLLSELQMYTPEDLQARVGFVGAGSVVRVRLAIVDTVTSLDPCADTSPNVVEEVQVLFDRTDTPTVIQNTPTVEVPLNCVAPHDPLDLDVGSDCSVTLGHIVGNSDGTLSVLYTGRHGVSPQFGIIRNQQGTTSITLGQMMIEVDGVAPVVEGVAVSRPALFTQQARFLGRTTFENAGGASVQATRVAFVGKTFAAGAPWNDDGRIFVFPGGAGNLTDNQSDVPERKGGLAAVPCQLASGTVDRAGIVLQMEDPIGTTVQVKRASASNPLPFQLDLFGLSAARSAGGIVPVAVTGLLRVTVDVDAKGLELGAPLTASNQDSGRLMRATSLDHYVLARAAGTAPPTPPDTTGAPQIVQVDLMAWVVHPPVKHNHAVDDDD